MGGNALCGGIGSPVSNLEARRSPVTCLALSANLPTDKETDLLGGERQPTRPAGLLWSCWIRGAGSGPPAVMGFLMQAAMKAEEENLLC